MISIRVSTSCQVGPYASVTMVDVLDLHGSYMVVTWLQGFIAVLHRQHLKYRNSMFKKHDFHDILKIRQRHTLLVACPMFQFQLRHMDTHARNDVHSNNTMPGDHDMSLHTGEQKIWIISCFKSFLWRLQRLNSQTGKLLRIPGGTRIMYQSI